MPGYALAVDRCRDCLDRTPISARYPGGARRRDSVPNRLLTSCHHTYSRFIRRARSWRSFYFSRIDSEMTESTATPSDVFSLPTDADTQRVTVSNWKPDVTPRMNLEELGPSMPCVPENYQFDPAPWVMEVDAAYNFTSELGAFLLPLNITKRASQHAHYMIQVVLQINFQPVSRSLVDQLSSTCEASCSSGSLCRRTVSLLSLQRRAMSDASSSRTYGNEGHPLTTGHLRPACDSRSTSTCCQTRQETQTHLWCSSHDPKPHISF